MRHATELENRMREQRTVMDLAREANCRIAKASIRLTHMKNAATTPELKQMVQEVLNILSGVDNG